MNAANNYTDAAVADANAKAVAIGQTTAQNAQKALDEAKRDLTNSYASQASQTASMASEANSKANQYASQAKSEAIAAATSADGVVRSEFKFTTDSMTATIQQNKSDADGLISQAQTTATQALDGLSTKVEKTEYNQRTGELSSKINETSDTAEQSKQDIVDIKETDSKQDNRMFEIEKDAKGIKQTVSDLSTEQGKISGSISTLKQRADGFEATITKVDNLAVGGRNLVLDTSTSFTGIGTNSTNGDFNAQGGQYFLAGGKKASDLYNQYGSSGYLTISFDWVASGDTISGWFSPQWNTAPWEGGLGAPGSIKPSITNKSGHYKSTVQLNFNGYSTSTATAIKFRQDNLQGTITVSNLKLEAGSIATDWTPAPEDLSSATAKAQLTADNATLAINNYKTDADGRISKAQADIKVNADNISTKVAKTDYDKKTGDLTTGVNRAQQTADTATQTIGTYKESNDRRVQAAETNIHANSEAIKATVSKTDFDRATGKLSGDISTLQQRADGFDATVTKVNNLAVGSRNLLLDTSTSFTVTGNNSTNGNFDAQGGRYYLAGGKKVSDLYNQYGPSRYLTFSFDWVASGDTISGWFSPQWNVSPWEGGLGALGAIKPSNANKSGHYKSTVQLNAYGYSTSIATFIRFRQDNLQGTITISNLKLEAGNVPTDWTPAPEDVNTQLAQVKLTADGVYQTVNDPKTGLNTRVSTAEGNFTKVQGTVSDMSTTVKDTADGLTREIENRKTGDNNTLQAGKDFTTSQITSYNTGIQSQFSQTSNALVAQISSLNLLNNSQFEVVNGTLPGWHVDTPWGATVKVGDTSSETVSIYGPTGDGSVSLHHNHAVNNTSWLYSDPIPASGGQTFSGSFEIVEGGGWNTSAQVTFARYIRFFDANKTLISNAAQNYYGTQIGASWPRYTFTVTTPSNTAFVAFGAGWNGGRIAFRRFAMYAGSTDYGYMPSSKSGNQTVLQLFQDNWAIGIKDNAGNLINGINGDTSGMTIAAKKLAVSADTTFLGTNWMNGAIIKSASIGTAQIADAAINSAKISSLDVSKLSGNITNFIKSYWSNAYQNLQIDANAIDFTATSSRTKIENGALTLWQNAGGYYRLGGLKTLKSSGSGEDVHTAGVYLSLDEWQTTNNGDKYWNYGGEDFFGGSEIGLAHSTGVDSSGNPTYSALMKWSNPLAAGRQSGVSKGFNFFDDINFQGRYFLVNGAANKMKFTWVSWSDWGDYHLIALTNETAKAGIAMNSDNLVLFGVGKRADATGGWKA